MDLGLTWNVTTNITELCEVKTGWQSYGPLASIIFPHIIFCRKCCKRNLVDKYYVVHRNGEHLHVSEKQQRLKDRKSWFLQDNWKDLASPSLEGNSWLVGIYNNIRWFAEICKCMWCTLCPYKHQCILVMIGWLCVQFFRTHAGSQVFICLANSLVNIM